MSRIIFNGENISGSLRRGLSLVLTLATIGSFTGCATNEVEDTSVPSTTLSDSLLEESNPIYDFTFNDSAVVEKVDEVYDWSEIESSIRTMDDEAWYLMYSSHDTATGISKNRYAVMICEDKYEFANTYYKIVDAKEGCLLRDEYEDVFKVNDNTLILCKKSAVDRSDLEEKYTFTIFNQVTGETVDIEALNLTGFNGFIIKSNYENVDGTNKLTYELLNDDGTKATDVIYDNRQLDYETGILYLTKDGVTEALDTKTKKAQKIDGIVEEVSHGYAVVSRKSDEKSTTDVIYLADVNEAPKQLMSYESRNISIGIADTDNPVFVVMKYNHETSSYDCLFVDKDNNTLTEGDYDFVMREYETDMVKGFKYVKLGDGRTCLIDLVDGRGNVVVDDATHDSYNPIPGTEMAIVRADENSSYGIVDFDGNYVMMPQFDKLYAHPIYQRQEDGSLAIVDCYIIGRNELQNKTTVYTPNFDVVAEDDLGLLEAEDVAGKSYSDKVAAKKFVKEN